MMYYFDESDESDSHALPDVEVFYAEAGDLELEQGVPESEQSEAGWYYWFCFPGCLPESDPSGPYPSEEAAIEACREMWGD